MLKQEADEEDLRSIMNEIKIMKQIDHPHLVKIYEYFEDPEWIYIVMEILEGGELFDKIKESKHFTENRSRKVIKEILEAVNYLHH